MRKPKRTSGPTIPESERRARGQARVRLTREGTEALAALRLPGESQSEALERVLVLAAKSSG